MGFFNFIFKALSLILAVVVNLLLSAGKPVEVLVVLVFIQVLCLILLLAVKEDLRRMSVDLAAAPPDPELK